MKVQKRIILLGLAGVILSGLVFSHLYSHEKNRKELIEIASEIAQNWQSKLNLNQFQTQVLENIIIEYTIKKNEILNSDYAYNLKISKLKNIQNSENNKLKIIFSNEQFEKYVTINKRLPSTEIV